MTTLQNQRRPKKTFSVLRISTWSILLLLGLQGPCLAQSCSVNFVNNTNSLQAVVVNGERSSAILEIKPNTGQSYKFGTPGPKEVYIGNLPYTVFPDGSVYGIEWGAGGRPIIVEQRRRRQPAALNYEGYVHNRTALPHSIKVTQNDETFSEILVSQKSYVTIPFPVGDDRPLSVIMERGFTKSDSQQLLFPGASLEIVGNMFNIELRPR